MESVYAFSGLTPECFLKDLLMNITEKDLHETLANIYHQITLHDDKVKISTLSDAELIHTRLKILEEYKCIEMISKEYSVRLTKIGLALAMRKSCNNIAILALIAQKD